MIRLKVLGETIPLNVDSGNIPIRTVNPPVDGVISVCGKQGVVVLDADDVKAVSYEEQTLTEEEKAQARENIDVPNEDDITDIIAEYLPIDSASGSIASFVDGAKDIPVEALKVNISPVQSGSGDPSPTNIRPISGYTQADVVVCGGNLFPTFTGSDSNGLTSTINADGSIHVSGRASGGGGYITAVRTFPKISSGVTITWGIGTVLTGNLRAFFKNAELGNAVIKDINAGVTSNTFTLGKDIYGVQFYFSTVANTDYDFTIYPQMNVGSTIQPYSKYNGTTHTIPFGQTVYGGSLEVETGVLTVDKVLIDMGDLSWTYSNNYFRTDYFKTRMKKPTSTTVKANAICEQYATKTWQAITTEGFAVNTTGEMIVADSRYNTASAFTTGVSGAHMCYELATPTTIQLTPVEVSTILGQNNIYSNCNGTVEVVYRADIQKYVDKKISALASLI